MRDEDLVPQRETFNRAIQWISDQRVEHPTRPIWTIVDEAGPRFNLTAAQSEALWQTFVGRPKT